MLIVLQAFFLSSLCSKLIKVFYACNSTGFDAGLTLLACGNLPAAGLYCELPTAKQPNTTHPCLATAYALPSCRGDFFCPKIFLLYRPRWIRW